MQIFIVGIGPGGYEYMTYQAKECISSCDVVVGYTVYLDLIKELIEDKEKYSTPMKQEIDRCKIVLDKALEGKKVAFVCSGDAGVYGMAGLMYEVAKNHPEVEIKVISGVTAACSGAAVLGAPLIHDFAVISLSDLLTPWEKIAKRLDFASKADFVICLYNPKSKKRVDLLRKACEIVAENQSWEIPCGYVKNIGREQEQSFVCTLKELSENEEIDMFTTVFIGNSTTKIINGKLVTPRGYKNEK